MTKEQIMRGDMLGVEVILEEAQKFYRDPENMKAFEKWKRKKDRERRKAAAGRKKRCTTMYCS